MASENPAFTPTYVKDEDMSNVNDMVDMAIEKWSPDHSVQEIMEEEVNPTPPTRDQIIKCLQGVPGLVEVITSTSGASLNIIDVFSLSYFMWHHEQSINLDVEILNRNRLRQLSLKAGHDDNYLEKHLEMRIAWCDTLIWSYRENGCCCDYPPDDMNEKGRFDDLELENTVVVRDGLVLTSRGMEMWWMNIRPTLGIFPEESS